VRGERDRREATVRGAILSYYVSWAVLTVAVSASSSHSERGEAPTGGAATW